MRLSIYWTKRVKKPGWFYAKLGAWHQKKKKCNIHWEDGGNIWLNLNKHKFKLKTLRNISEVEKSPEKTGDEMKIESDFKVRVQDQPFKNLSAKMVHQEQKEDVEKGDCDVGY